MKKTIVHPQIGEVVLSRTRRARRISLSVRPNGSVRLSFPSWVTQRQALGFLEQKVEWVAASRAKMRAKYPTPPSLTEEQKAETKRFTEELRKRAKIELPKLVEELAARHGFRYGTIKIKNTKTRWGSCTANNDINLSLSLLKLPRYLAEYVVLHELCHTVHHDHSARFHRLLDTVTAGHHKALSRELRAYRPGE